MEKSEYQMEFGFWGGMIMAHLTTGWISVFFAAWSFIACVCLLSISAPTFWSKYVGGFWARVWRR